MFPTDYRWRLRVERYASAVEVIGFRGHMTRVVAPRRCFLQTPPACLTDINSLSVLAAIKINMLFEKGQTLI